MQIAIALIVLALCGGFLFWFKRSEDNKKKNYNEDEEREAAQRQTAQEFVNAKDLGENCLYTLDNMIFAAVQIEGICLELYSRAELKNISRTLSTRLSSIRYPYKYLAVSRPVDISKSLQEYEELCQTAEGGRRKLLKNEMNELADMVMSGETLERLYYFVIWNSSSKEDERDIVKRGNELRKIFEESGMQATVIDKKAYVRLCNLVNNPAYVHMEGTDIQDVVTVLRAD